MLVTLEEAKEYLKVEFEDEDTLILTLLSTAEGMCGDILRKELMEEADVAKTAVLYAVGVLYEKRGTDIKELIPTLKCILSSRRKEVF
ncbi:phage gp6-like head-tail connector protein [Lactonifactor sp. BIOML-A3]|uniref:head-tail connector protein n=1 Tax=unclassified Lactonifactor TaxID=2636670 RepID=UPI0012AF7694|nr:MULTISPECIES: head-tail connector protein [unclassified Lactonifactor]MSA03363.1 phage gp6-like head-tail connector protein [Lactonifactor sp. BIOML-A5]MSA09712.1 phage gp6-like head-tail connector protein [Lactonifactor sp. BIOML-A4]MSA14254.1 phage gp6-like head-tail connector protein [Lactonifactor sp. BIOML-A3]MSA18717.1 phage gp6-like head-tail connector protein [Lactonifactor sp. BIOML-A2]MSA39499.1 phage gp6-like head-tail connector protein [Lactonifactor sp. BIOML-A1]